MVQTIEIKDIPLNVDSQVTHRLSFDYEHYTVYEYMYTVYRNSSNRTKIRHFVDVDDVDVDVDDVLMHSKTVISLLLIH